jgi:hypothetical protein
MARSVTVWVVEQYGAYTGDYSTIATFTVKHEMQYFLNKLPQADLRRCRVKRFKDGVTFTWNNNRELEPFKPSYADIPMSGLIQ